jgi:hypothetical protein
MSWSWIKPRDIFVHAENKTDISYLFRKSLPDLPVVQNSRYAYLLSYPGRSLRQSYTYWHVHPTSPIHTAGSISLQWRHISYGWMCDIELRNWTAASLLMAPERPFVSSYPRGRFLSVSIAPPPSPSPFIVKQNTNDHLSKSLFVAAAVSAFTARPILTETNQTLIHIYVANGYCSDIGERKLSGVSPRVNYTHRATASCQRS